MLSKRNSKHYSGWKNWTTGIHDAFNNTMQQPNWPRENFFTTGVTREISSSKVCVLL